MTTIKKLFLKNQSYLIFIILIISSLFFSCHHEKQEQVIVEKEYIFENENWSFEQRIVNFTLNIPELTEPCKLLLTLEYDSTKNTIPNIPIVVSTYSPDGAEYHIQSSFNFKDNASITPKKNSKADKIITQVIYKERYFNISGDYRFSVYENTGKYNNFGIKKLKIKIVK